MSLLRLVSWPYVRRHLTRTVLTIAGILLGVAVFVGMHTANQAVLAAFSQTIERIAGKTELQVTAGEAGFAEDILEKVQSASTVRVAVPVIEAVVESGLTGQGTLLVLGIDMTGDRSLRDYDLASGEDAIVEDPLVFLAQPDSLIVSRQLAEQNGAAVGSPLTLQTAEGEKRFIIRGVMEPVGLATAFGGNLAIMDVYAAQAMFGRGRTFDRIDLAVRPGATLADCERELAGLLGPGFQIQPPASRGRQAETMLAGYSLMVSISSAFALFVGMFIIYNAFAVAVTERRAEIGILRALGATRGQIRRLFLAEGAVMGVVGSMLGLVLGLLAARALASTIGTLAGGLYGVADQTAPIAATPAVVGVSLAIGVATSLVAAMFPAWNASRVDPVQALQKGRYQVLSAGESRLRARAAAVLGAFAGASLILAEGGPASYAGYACVIAAALLLGPMLSLGLAKAIRPLLAAVRPVEGVLAADSLIQAPRRTSATVLALMLSVALVIAFSGMARATRGLVLNWLDTTLNPDLFVMPSQRLDLRTTRFPAAMAGEIAELPGVERVQMFRNSRITFRGAPIMAVALEMSSVAETSRVAPVAGRSVEMYREAAAGRGLIISESLARLQALDLGDVMEIAAPYGTIRLPIVGVIVDYTDQQGSVFMDRRVFLERFRDDAVSDFRVYVASDANVGDVRRRIVERYTGARQVFVLTNEESRRYVLDVADQWFGLMNVQIAMAVLVAVLGIVNSLTVSIADRQRELGVLQAVGALKSQVRRTIWMEAVAVALLGLILGYALGALNLYYVLDIVQRDVAGLRLDYEYPVMTVLTLAPIMLVAAFVAALWPSEAAVRRSLVEALAYE